MKNAENSVCRIPILPGWWRIVRGFRLVNRNVQQVLFLLDSFHVRIDISSCFFCFFIVAEGLFPAFGDACSFLVAKAQITQSPCIPLVCGFAVPFHRQFEILRNAITAMVAGSETVLRNCVSLICGFTVPFCR